MTNIPDFNHFLAKADALTAEAEARITKAATIRNAVAVLAEFAANDDNEPLGGPPAGGKVAEFAHEVDVAAVEASVVVAPVEAPAVPVGKADTAILAALNVGWQTARDIHDVLTAAGVELSRSAVYQRMPILTARYPALIEQKAGAKEWRAKSLITAPVAKASVNPKAVKVTKSINTAVGKRGTKAVNDNPVQRITLNDNSITIPMVPNRPAVPLAQRLAPALHHGHCLDVLCGLPDASVHLILADNPYCTTRNSVDREMIDVNALWREYRRLVTPTGNIVLFGSDPFSTKMKMGALDLHKYDMLWVKDGNTGAERCHHAPLKRHEDIMVFSPGTNVGLHRTKRRATFNPQGLVSLGEGRLRAMNRNHLGNNTPSKRVGEIYEKFTNFPATALYCPKDRGKLLGTKRHDFAKPVALLEYLVRTYSNAGEVVLDNAMGSGSTMIAALRTGRHGIGVEITDEWFDFSERRVKQDVA